jgi:hypothetical protein
LAWNAWSWTVILIIIIISRNLDIWFNDTLWVASSIETAVFVEGSVGAAPWISSHEDDPWVVSVPFVQVLIVESVQAAECVVCSIPAAVRNGESRCAVGTVLLVWDYWPWSSNATVIVIRTSWWAFAWAWVPGDADYSAVARARA